MPLKPGKSKGIIASNIREFHGGKTYAKTAAKFGKERADRQAIAAAMSNARKYADGGEASEELRKGGLRYLRYIADADKAQREVTMRSFPSLADIQARQAQRISDAVPRAKGGALDPLPEHPSPPIVPKEWPPHPLEPRKAGGGFVPPKMPWFERAAARTMMTANKPRAVMLQSSVPGRTDKLPLKVPSGSYVLPADVVAGVGQGNSAAGANKIIKDIASGKFRAPKLPIGKIKKMPYKMHLASGGRTKEVPIMAAGGEVVIHPHGVADIGHGDMEHGHNYLDKWVVDQRKKNIRTLKRLKPPVKE